ncbi:uncharacterized protein RHOBADRAFT_46038 [Rhodotorula graminis WP1]|uniref:Uncharacterized protein n=1 Tax=Rhodotorula graminis (strain WP1) TaxID=578459 RepID=A0A0P9EI41_RHOGW|nr:uncharacterized protein RHOBADRAFT_46038 [Rhodotorula graminis WP1]KPV72943.1 hypothetical protein RHOBADRAFT_46038 [Rhodotorula graminis WP1]
MLYASTSSLTVALVASAAVFASQAQALPTSRSTSTVARRAHIASHHSRAARAVPATADSTTSLGDHSIVVDASTSADAGQGGIRNSTVNLTSISKRTKADREGTLSSFSRVVRSLFGRAVPAAPAVFKPLPLTYSPPVSGNAAPSASSSSSHKKRRSHHKKRRVVRQPRANAPLKGNTRTLPNGLILELADTHTHLHLANVKRRQNQAVAAAQLAHERRQANYTLAAAQASAYSVAVAALGDAEPTASPVVDAQAAAPTSFVNMTGPPRSSLNDTAGAIAAALSPVTLTITLVPSGIDGALVDAAFLPTATASPSPSPAKSSAAAVVRSSSPSISNPKASSTRESSPDPTWTAILAAFSAYTPPLAATASPAPAPASAALSAVKRGMERRVVARVPGAHPRRAPVVHAAPVVKYYPAPA